MSVMAHQQDIDNQTIDPSALPTLAPEQLRARRDAFDRLVVSISDQTHVGVRPVRSCPVSAPRRFVALWDVSGQEIGLIADLDDLDDESGRVLLEELDLTHLTVQVLAVQAIESRFGMTSWKLETTRGFRVAHLKDRSQMRWLPAGRVILTDVLGMRFEIRDTAELDDRSKALLETES